MDQHPFDRVTASLAEAGTRRTALRRLSAVALTLSGISLITSSTTARRKKGGKGGGLSLIHI